MQRWCWSTEGLRDDKEVHKQRKGEKRRGGKESAKIAKGKNECTPEREKGEGKSAQFLSLM